MHKAIEWIAARRGIFNAETLAALFVLGVAALAALLTFVPRPWGVNPLAILWTALSGGGVVTHSLALYDAVADLRAIPKESADVTYCLLARGHVRTEVARLIVKALFTLMGITAMFAPAGTVWASYVFTVALVTSVALLTAESVLDRRDRRRLNAILLLEHARHE